MEMDPETQDLRALVIAAIQRLPLKQAGLLLLDAGRAMLEKQNNFSPHGSNLMRLAANDGTLTVCLARNDLAPILSHAHDAIKKHVGF